MAGLFDDLIPQNGARSGAGLFDDLIPVQATASQPASAPSIVPGSRPAPPVDDVPWWEHGPQPEPAPPRDELRGLKIGVQGSGRGIADFLGTPVDLAAGGMNALAAGAETAVNAFREEPISIPRVTKPMGGSDSIADLVGGLAESAGYEPVMPETGAEKLSYNANRFGAGSIAGGAALARGAASRFAPGQGPIYPRTGDDLLRPYADDAGRALGVDAAAGVGSGVGVTASDALVPEDSKLKPLADFLGALVGGYAGAETAMMPSQLGAAGSALRNPVERSIPYDENLQPTTRRVADKAATSLQESATSVPDAVAGLSAAQADAAANGYTMPTSGIASGDPGLSMLENRLRTQNNVPFVERDRAVRTDAADRLAGVGPQGVDPQLARTEVERLRDEQVAVARGNRDDVDLATGQAVADAERQAAGMRGQAQQQARDAEQQHSAAAGRLSAAEAADRQVALNVRPAEIPAAQQEASRDFTGAVIDRGLRPVTAEKNRRFEAADPDGTVMVNVAPLGQTVESIRERANALRASGVQMPVGVMERIDRMAARTTVTDRAPAGQTGMPELPDATVTTGGQVSWKDLSELRRDLRTMQDSARRAGDYTLADSINELKAGIDAEADRLATLGGQTGRAIEEARTYYRDVYAPVFAGNTTGRRLRDDTFQGRAPEPSKVLQTYYLTANPTQEVATDLARIVQASQTPEEATGAVRRYLVADMAKAIDANGNVNLPVLRKWRENRGPVLDDPQFGSVRQEVDEFIRGAVNRRGEQTRLGQELRQFEQALRDAERGATLVDREAAGVVRTAERQRAVELRRAEEGIADTERRVNSGALGILLNADPARAARRILDSDDADRMMQQTVSTLSGNKQAAQAWKRAVADALDERVRTTVLTPDGQGEVSLAGLIRSMDRYRQPLARVFTPEEMNLLESVKRQLQPYQNLRLQATTGSPTAERWWAPLMRPVELGAKATLGILKGGGVTRTIRLALEQLPDDSAAVQKLLVRSMTDPDLARLLLGRSVEKPGTPQWNAKLTRLVGLSAAARASTQAQEDDSAAR